MHVVKQREINMPYPDRGVKVFGEPLGDLPGDPVLAPGTLNKDP
jgi:hypothetical protein